MRLLIYGDIGGSGGYIRYCRGLLGSDSIPEDFEIWLVISEPFLKKIAPLDSKIKIITHPWMICKSRFKRYLWHLWIYPRLVNNIKPDIEFYPSGQLRVYFRKALTIATCHNLLLFDKKELERIGNKKEQHTFQLYRKNQTRSFQKSDAIIFLSNHSQKLVTREVKGIKQSTIIAHGLDDFFLRSEERSYEFKNAINMLYVSPFFYYKHQIEVVKAAQQLRHSTGLDIRLTLVGGGNSSAAIQLNEYIIKENINNFVIIKGNVDHKEVLQDYNSADLFIFASSCETFGITLLEAMGARLPIACSNRTGLSEILKDAGVYFDPEDTESIVSIINKLLNDLKLRETLGNKAYS